MRARKTLALLLVAMVAAAFAPSFAEAQDSRSRYGSASLFTAAERGDARAQTRIGFMHESGRGMPQDYFLAASWYRRAAEQGFGPAQYRLGMLYDKGQGVRENYLEAYKWLNLAAANAGPGRREYYLRLRDGVAAKLTLNELGLAQGLSSHWQPQPER